jgi:uncharacterized membrane protein YciS (DUF1049 family)
LHVLVFAVGLQIGRQVAALLHLRVRARRHRTRAFACALAKQIRLVAPASAIASASGVLDDRKSQIGSAKKMIWL